jgi:putative glycerol-1-phosphate prenyltransferase
MTNNIYKNLQASRQERRHALAVLIDPDRVDVSNLKEVIGHAQAAKADYFFIGGSLVLRDDLEKTMDEVSASGIPSILFPGSTMQISSQADAIFFLSVISGRNPDLLIGRQVTAAPVVRESGLEVIPTGYMIVDGGAPTTVSYMSNTNPIPRNKEDIAAVTAMAGEMLGLKCLYMDAGSGAQGHIPLPMIQRVRGVVDIPIVVGGGIRTPEEATQVCAAGADVIVVGSAIEDDPMVVHEISAAIHATPSIPK